MLLIVEVPLGGVESNGEISDDRDESDTARESVRERGGLFGACFS